MPTVAETITECNSTHGRERKMVSNPSQISSDFRFASWVFGIGSEVPSEEYNLVCNRLSFRGGPNPVVSIEVGVVSDFLVRM